MMKEAWTNKIEESLVQPFYEEQSPEEQNEGFSNQLNFGTAGIRGKFGLGNGRLNNFTVARVAYGLAEFLKQHEDQPSVVIHYDTRHLSPEFAQIIANILSSYQVKVYLPDTYKTTPHLSFAVRYLKTSAGVMITASHNPKDYNGIKVYNEDGAQLSTTLSEELSQHINKFDDPLSLEVPDDTTYIHELPEEVKTSYMSHVKQLVGTIPDSDLKVIFTSLHGTSVPTVPNLLDDLNFNQYTLVASQCKPDPNFSSVKSANPEDAKAFDLAVELAHEEDADLIIGTDPDADRLGIVERDQDGNIYYYNGNQIGALLLNYRIKQTSDLSQRVMIQSIVSSELAINLAKHYDIETKQVLTGFKFIAEEIKHLDPNKHFIFAYEESYGYLAEPFVRDKDAVQIVPLIIKYVTELKQQGKMLKDELAEIYNIVGFHQDKLFSHTFEAPEDKGKIDNIMEEFRNHPPTSISDLDVIAIEDFEKRERFNMATETTETIDLPRANVIKVYFNEGFIALRPSGTEPKIKLYVSLSSDNFDHIAEEINQYIFS